MTKNKLTRRNQTLKTLLIIPVLFCLFAFTSTVQAGSDYLAKKKSKIVLDITDYTNEEIVQRINDKLNDFKPYKDNIELSLKKSNSTVELLFKNNKYSGEDTRDGSNEKFKEVILNTEVVDLNQNEIDFRIKFNQIFRMNSGLPLAADHYYNNLLQKGQLIIRDSKVLDLVKENEDIFN